MKLIKRKDDPELFEKYLHTFFRERKKLQIAFLKLKREIGKAFPFLPYLANKILTYLENKLSK